MDHLKLLQKAIKYFQEDGYEIICFLGNFETNLHNHQKVKKQLA
jgi:hypothetical protein